jgi:hypothetical protein
MIKNKKKLAEFEKRLMEAEDLTYDQKFKLFDELFKEAVSLGVFNDENIMEGIEVDIRIARALNGLGHGKKTNKKNSSKIR